MKSVLRITSFMMLFFAFSFYASPVNADDICTENPDPRFNDNYNPISRFGGGCFAADPGCSCTTSTTGCGVVLDVTPRDASNTPTNTHQGVTWSCTGFNIGGTTGDRCFHPRGTYTGTGIATCTVTAASGANYTFTFGSGGGTGGPGDPTPTFKPGDVGESDPYCAYQQGTAKICVPGTEGATTATCAANATCVSKGGCTVIERSQCERATVTPNIYTVKDLPPGDLGAFIKRIFDVSLSVVGLTVFAMVVYGGFLMLLAGGLPSMNADGKKYITNAFLGALLLFAAYVILNTINPNLVRQNGILPPLPAQQNVVPKP